MEGCNKSKIINLNPFLLTNEFKENFKNNWEKFEELSIENLCEFYPQPYKLCVVQKFLSTEPAEFHENLIKDFLNINWSKKQLDLYEFYQSNDIIYSNNKEFKCLNIFRNILEEFVKPWIEELCQIKISSISASCSMYNCGDYLLVHDDLMNDRQIAFVYYISPWLENWTPDMGGALEIFDRDSDGYPKFPVEKKLSPKNNQFIFFEVDRNSFHQVGEVENFNWPRLSINGWFNGKTREREITQSLKSNCNKINFYKEPAYSNSTIKFSEWINSYYLTRDVIKEINQHIEIESEIKLENFLLSDVYRKICRELVDIDSGCAATTSNNLGMWTTKGPANNCKYEILNFSKLQNETLLKEFYLIMKSINMFKFLHKLSGLDFYGRDSKSPKCLIELQKWQNCSYTILGKSIEIDNKLDLIMYFNVNDSIGVVTYLDQKGENIDEVDADDEEENSAVNSNVGNSQIVTTADEDNDDDILLTISPSENSLNIVFSGNNSMNFTKYVSKSIPLNNGPTYILYCSYKE